MGAEASSGAAGPVVRVERKDGIAMVIVDRPQALNALNEEVRRQLAIAFRDLEGDPDVGGIVLTGAGEKAFVAGADIGAMSKHGAVEAYRMAVEGQALLSSIERSSKPVIAAVNGYALGGGLELAMACDFIVAAEGAKLGQPEVALGVIPGFAGTQRLARLVGPHKAKQLCMTGEQVTAEEALRIGLVAEVVPKPRLLDRCRELLEKIRQNGPLAVRLAKHVVHQGSQADLDSGSALEAAAFALTFATEDQKEGMRAFLEKRKPAFRGR